ncbi:MAG: zinc finger domain-containing protein, partial [Streptosporangiaceae bacterium]
MTASEQAPAGDAEAIEALPCPRCKAEPGSPCRSRAGAVTTVYH